MARKSSGRRRRSRGPEVLGKPRGVIHPRVAKVGPEHFGIVSVDCAKARSKWMLADFYGNVFVPPTVVAHNRVEFEAAVRQVKEAIHRHGIEDLLVAVERTGRYHHPVQRAFAAGAFEVRTVHPFATKQFRLPASPGVKTDDVDLAAIHLAAVNGFALIEASLDESWRELQLLTRHRRDLVRKTSILCCQIKEHLDAAMPGYAACFPKLWEHPAALHLVWQFGSAEAMRRAGLIKMSVQLRRDGIRYQERTVERVVEWAQNAAPRDVAAEGHRRIAEALNGDREQKEQQIRGLEREIAAKLVRTPYVLLMSIPGVNVVSAAEFAGEMGPIGNYANARCITGRAGLYPSRYQSDAVDLKGSLVRCANRSLRYAILQIADNLIVCNHHFSLLAARWQQAGKDPRHTRVRVGLRFCRIAFQMVAGGQVFHHPCCRDRSYILDKLMTFHKEHGTPAPQVLTDLQAALPQIPRAEYAAEAVPLRKELEAIQEHRRRGPQPIGEILPLVLASLSVVQSGESGDQGPT